MNRWKQHRKLNPLGRARLTGHLLLLAAITLPVPGMAAGGGKATPSTDPFNEVPDFAVSGRFAETCTDTTLCGAWFGTSVDGGVCRKVMLFQFIRSRYGSIKLHNLTAMVAVESGNGLPITIDNCDTWQRCDLTLPDTADSAEADALRNVLAVMLWGRPPDRFTSVRRLPLAVGISEDRIIAESGDRLKIRIRPVRGPAGGNPPQARNVVLPFPYLGAPYIYRADTLSYVLPGEPAVEGTPPKRWITARSSAALTVFSWTRDAAMREAGIKRE